MLRPPTACREVSRCVRSEGAVAHELLHLGIGLRLVEAVALLHLRQRPSTFLIATASGCVTLLHFEEISVAETRLELVIFILQFLFVSETSFISQPSNVTLARANANSYFLYYSDGVAANLRSVQCDSLIGGGYMKI